MPLVLRPDGTYRSQQRFSLYRWHITDPIRFRSDLRVTMQALGWRVRRPLPAAAGRHRHRRLLVPDPAAGPVPAAARPRRPGGRLAVPALRGAAPCEEEVADVPAAGGLVADEQAATAGGPERLGSERCTRNGPKNTTVPAGTACCSTATPSAGSSGVGVHLSRLSPARRRSATASPARRRRWLPVQWPSTWQPFSTRRWCVEEDHGGGGPLEIVGDAPPSTARSWCTRVRAGARRGRSVEASRCRDRQGASSAPTRCRRIGLERSSGPRRAPSVRPEPGDTAGRTARRRATTVGCRPPHFTIRVSTLAVPLEGAPGGMALQVSGPSRPSPSTCACSSDKTYVNPLLASAAGRDVPRQLGLFEHAGPPTR